MAKNTSGPSNSSKPTTTTTTNSIYGTDSDDYIFGTSGNDIVFANKGDDVVDAGAGNDIVYGGDGNDVIIHNVNDNKGFKDFYDAGAGTDTLQLVVTQDQYNTLQKALADFNASDKTQTFDFSKYSKDINLKIVNFEHITFEIVEPVLKFQSTQTVTTDKDDTLMGTNLNDMLVGGPGNDTIYGKDGNDRLVGGEGNDMLIGGKGNDVIIGGAGEDCVNAGAGNDFVNTSSGPDTVVHFVDENQGFHDYYQDSGTSVQNDGMDTLFLVFNDSDYAKITSLINQMEADFDAAKKNGVVFDFSQYNAALSAALGYTKTLDIGTKGFEHLEVINATEAQQRADEGDACFGEPTVNHAPVANPDHFSMNEDDANGTTITLGNKLANDTDADGNTLKVVSVQNVTLDKSNAGPEFANMQISLEDGVFNDGDGATILLSMNGKTATINIDENGNETISDPDHLFNALDTGESLVINASYTNSDGSLTSSAAQTITINGVNDAPIANPDHFSMNEDDANGTTITLGNKLANDTDVDMETLKVVSVQNVTLDKSNAGPEFANMQISLEDGVFNDGDGATILLSMNGKTATINIDENGNETISDPDHLFNALDTGESLVINASYTNSDGSLTSSADQSITINGVNDAPIANPDHFSMNEDDANGTTITLGNKLANDTDVDMETLKVVSVQNVTLDKSNAGPEFANMQISLEDGVFNDGDGATILLSMDGKTATINIDENGSETISDPDHLFNALDTGESLVINASYTNSDGSLTSSADQTITINGVNDAPVANPDDYVMNEDDAFNGTNNTITLGNKLSNDTDVDQNTLKVVSVQGVSVDVSNAGSEFAGMTATLDNGSVSVGNPAIVTLHLNGHTATVQVGSDGFETMTDPDHIFDALDSGEKIVLNASYTNSDGSLTSSADQSITINGVNDAPIANPDHFSMNEDDANGTTITLGNKLANDTDVDVETLKVVSVQNVTLDKSNAGPEFANMQISLEDGVFNDGDGATILLSMDGKTATINIDENGNETISDPDHLFNALDTGESLIINASYTNSDGSLTSSADQTITINGANDAPVANPDDYVMNEDDAFNGTNNTITLGNKLSNDTDVDQNTLKVVSVQNVSVDVSNAGSEFAGMTATLDNGSVSVGNPAIVTLHLGSHTATVQVGSDGFETMTDPDHIFDALDSGEKIVLNASYTNSDGSLTSSADQSITINGVNDAPIANPDHFSMNEDDANGTTITLGNKLANDTDVDVETLKVVSVQNVSVDVSNAGSEFAGMTATLDNGSVSVGTPATVTLHLGGQTATINIASDGTETISDPNHLFDALDSGEKIIVNTSYTNSDGSLTSSADQSITINGVNDAPIANPDHFSMNEDDANGTTITLGNKLANDTDVDMETLKVVSVQNVTLDKSNAGPEFANMQISLQDGVFNDGDGATILLSMDGKTATINIDENGNETISDPDHLFNALDTGESLVVNASYTNSDGSLTSSAAQTITINGMNDAPMANPDDYVMNEDDAFNGANNTITLGNKLSNDTDVDQNTLKVVSVQNVSVDVSNAGSEFAGMTATLDNGSVSVGNPAIVTLHLGSHTATVQVGSDGFETMTDPDHIFDALDSGEKIVLNASYTNSDGSLTSSADQSITINGVNDAPIANPDYFSMHEDDAFNAVNHTITLGNKLANDTDVDGETLKVVSVQDVTLDKSNAGVAFANMQVSLPDGVFNDGDGATILLSMNGKTATVNIDENGNETISDPDHLFDALGKDKTIVINANYTNSDGSLTSTAAQSITIIGVNETLVASADTQDVTVYENALDLSKDGADLAAGHKVGTTPTSTGETDNTGNDLKNYVTGGSGEWTFTLLGDGVTSGFDSIANQNYTMLTGTNGVIKLFADGTFAYTLTDPVTGPQANNGADIRTAESFTYKVMDTDGQMATSTISVNVVDDFPIANVRNGIAQNSSDTMVHGTLVNMGADSDGAHIELSLGTMPAGLSSNGVALVYSTSLDGSTITAKAGVGGPVVFELKGLSDGSYDFHQVAPLDLSVLTSDLQSSVGAGGPQPAYYFYTNGQFGSTENAFDWTVKITGSGNVNPSTQGMGVDNNLFEKDKNHSETLKLEFDDEGNSTVNHGHANLTYIAKIGVTGFSGNETMTYVAHYTDGTSSGTITLHPGDLDASGQFTVQAPIGKYLDDIDLAAGPTDTSVRLKSLTTFTLDDTQPKVLNFGYKAIDGDGDTQSGTFSITETNSSSLTVPTSANTAVGGGIGDNVIMGNTGHDILTGGLGNDVITGGQGADTFVFDLVNNAGLLKMQGNDTIMDLNGAQGDHLLFHNVPDIATLNAKTLFSDTGAGNADLLITFTDGGSITLKGFGSHSITNFIDLNNYQSGVVVVA